MYSLMLSLYLVWYIYIDCQSQSKADLTQPAVLASIHLEMLLNWKNSLALAPVIFLLGLVCVCVCASARAIALQEAISGFKYAELQTRSCIYNFRALATMDLAIGHIYTMLLSVSVHRGVCV